MIYIRGRKFVNYFFINVFVYEYSILANNQHQNLTRNIYCFHYHNIFLLFILTLFFIIIRPERVDNFIKLVLKIFVNEIYFVYYMFFYKHI